MDRYDADRDLICRILTEYGRVPPANGKFRWSTVFDRTNDRYVLLLIGCNHEDRYTNTPILHVDLIDGKFWIQYDGTEYGVAQELEDAGIPKSRIVLGYKSPEMRELMDYAVA